MARHCPTVLLLCAFQLLALQLVPRRAAPDSRAPGLRGGCVLHGAAWATHNHNSAAAAAAPLVTGLTQAHAPKADLGESSGEPAVEGMLARTQFWLPTT